MADISGTLIVGEVGAAGLRSASLELVTAANELGGPITALLFGAGVHEAAAVLSASGVDRVLVVDHPDLALPSAEAATSVIAKAVAQVQPAFVLMLSTTLASEYAPSLAARLGGPLASDVFALRVEARDVIATRPAVGGRLQTDVTLRGGEVRFLAIRSGAFAKPIDGSAPAPIEAMQIELGDLDRRVRVTSVTAKEASGVGLESADIVVAGGRGLKDKASFALVEQLAAAIGGAVGATRAVTDLGWRPHDEQIGQTGKTVVPKLYIAAGISGAVQHTVGMTGAENIVVINRDPDAPIFKNASFGIVGDLFEILPALTAAITAAKS